MDDWRHRKIGGIAKHSKDKTSTRQYKERLFIEEKHRKMIEEKFEITSKKKSKTSTMLFTLFQRLSSI